MDQTVPKMEFGLKDGITYSFLVIAVSWLLFVDFLTTEFGILTVSESVTMLLMQIFAISPLIALILVYYRGTLSDVTAFLRDRLRLRIGWMWYLISLVILPGLLGAAFLVYVAFGGDVPPLADEAILEVIGVFTIGILFNLFENFGWRGYLQEVLQSHYSALVSCAIVGVVWGLWHAPLLLHPEAPFSELSFFWYMVMIVGLAVIFGWVYNSTRSVVPVTIMHCMFNAVIALVVISMLEVGIDASMFVTFSAIAAWVGVGLLLFRVDADTLRHTVPQT